MTVLFHVNTLGFSRGDVVTFSGEEDAFGEIELLVTHGMLEEVPE